MEFEALVCGSMVLASHQNGFRGVAFRYFFVTLLEELGMGSPNVMKNELEETLRDIQMTIPFLCPPNVNWPDFLMEEQSMNFGYLERPRDSDMVDLWVKNHTTTLLSGECKDYASPVNLETLKKILVRVPNSTSIHLVAVNNLQQMYFVVRGPDRQTFDEFVKMPVFPKRKYLKPQVQLYHARFYRIRKGQNTLHNIVGLENKCRDPACSTVCGQADRIVIFMELQRGDVSSKERFGCVKHMEME